MSDTIAGRYTLIDPIARGGSGTVWRSWDQRRNHVCAAKVLRQRDSADLLRFVREQSVKIDHPHVLAPYGWAAEDEHVVIAMDLSDGGTLENAIQDHGAFSDKVAEEILRQLISALQFVHAEGWIHRDVKPANLMMDATGTGRPLARLADFGIATQGEDARLTRIGTVVGTPGYIAPELLEGADPDPSQDLFAAGVVAMRMVRPDAERGITPTPEDALEAFGEDSLLGAEVAALLDPDPAVRHDGALSLMERLESSAGEDFGQATTRDGETFEIFQTLDPLPEAWQDIVSGHAEPPKEERTGENISQSGEAGERTPSTTVVPQQPGAQQIDAPAGGRLSGGFGTPPPGGVPLAGPSSGPAGTALSGMPSGLGGDGREVPAQAPPVGGGTASAAVLGPLPQGQHSRAALLGTVPVADSGRATAPQRSISWAGAHTPASVPVRPQDQPAHVPGAAGGSAGATLREQPSSPSTAPGAQVPLGGASQGSAPAGGASRATGYTAAPAYSGGASGRPAAGSSGSGAKSGPLSFMGVNGAGGWVVIGCVGAVLLAAAILIVVLMSPGGSEDPPPTDPTSSGTEESTGVPTTYVTQDPEDGGMGGTQLGGSGGNSFGG